MSEHLLQYHSHLDLLQTTCLDDVYILDTTAELQVVAQRSGSDRLHHGDRFYTILPPGGREAVRRYLQSFDQEPLLLDTEQGIAVLLANMVESTGFCIAIFPDVPKEALSSVILSGEIQSFTPVGIWTATEENPGRIARTKSILLQLHKRIHLFLSNPCRTAANAPRTETELQNQILYLAQYVRCPIRVQKNTSLPLNLSYNGDILRMFLLIMLSYCRRVAPKRETDILIEQEDACMFVNVCFDGDRDMCNPNCPEIASLSHLAKRQQLDFQTYFKDGKAFFRLNVSNTQADASAKQ